MAPSVLSLRLEMEVVFLQSDPEQSSNAFHHGRLTLSRDWKKEIAAYWKKNKSISRKDVIGGRHFPEYIRKREKTPSGLFKLRTER